MLKFATNVYILNLGTVFLSSLNFFVTFRDVSQKQELKFKKGNLSAENYLSVGLMLHYTSFIFCTLFRVKYVFLYCCYSYPPNS